MRAELEERTTDRIRVLLIEDNPGDTRLIREELADAEAGRATRFELESKESLGAGLEALAADAFDVVLLDLSLPDSHGLDTLERLQKDAPDVPVVVLTGLEDERAATTAVRQGAQDYLNKGHVDGDRLGRALNYAIERKAAARELDELQRQLAMSEKLASLGALVSGLAQEIRTSTTFITNTLFQVRQSIERAAEENPQVRELAGEVADHSASAMEGVERIDRLVRDLRRFTAGGGTETTTMGLHEAVHEAVDLFRASHQSRVTVVADLQPTPAIPLHPTQVQQVVLNLLTNAAEASQPGDTIWVSTRPRDGGGELEVKDEGEGIEPKARQHLFEPFFTTRPGAGGLGLAITQRIVDGHGGDIAFESRRGEGTTFRVHFPQRGDASASEGAG